MDNCPRCGEALGPAAGRYCINCGQRIDRAGVAEAYADWRTDTFERSALARDRSAAVALATTESTTAPPPVDPERPHRADGPAQRPPIGWLAALVGMVLVALLGAWLFFGNSSDETTPVAKEAPKASPSAVLPSPTTASKSPRKRPTKSPAAKPVDLSRQIAVTAPKPAAPSTDSSGRTVTYDAGQMLDGVPETCWRMPGDGTGSTVTFTLPQEAEITELGLINGYAKTASDSQGPLDWYHGNRRVLRATWAFDDGTEVHQELADSTSMQTIDVEHVRTSTVTLTLEEVSPPGTGRAARDYTAISDVSLLGVLG
jgi:hypothetical protein